MQHKMSLEKTATLLHWSVRCSYHVPSIMSIKWLAYLYFIHVAQTKHLSNSTILSGNLLTVF